MNTILDSKNFGPWAVITGASSGIGEEFSKQLAAQGFNLVLVARRKALLDQLAEELQGKFSIKCRVIQADLSDARSVSLIQKATADLEVGLLISNAGTGRPGRFLDFSIEELMYIVQLNALSHLALTHHFGNHMAKRGKGSVVLIGAMGAVDGIPYMANESGTKALVQALGKALHTEFQESGIHITTLITSPTDTPVVPVLFPNGSMPTKPVPVDQCVSETLHALRKNQISIIPGRKFRIMNALMPKSISRNVAGRMFKKNHVH